MGLMHSGVLAEEHPQVSDPQVGAGTEGPFPGGSEESPVTTGPLTTSMTRCKTEEEEGKRRPIEEGETGARGCSDFERNGNKCICFSLKEIEVLKKSLKKLY